MSITDEDVQEQEVDTPTEEPTSETSPTETPTETKPTRGTPSYELRRVGDELPDEPSAGRSRLYFDLLTAIKADEDGHGEWYQVARFTTTTGATDAKKAITEGKRDIPLGKWFFEARRELDETTGKRVSKLYARYGGEVE